MRRSLVILLTAALVFYASGVAHLAHMVLHHAHGGHGATDHALIAAHAGHHAHQHHGCDHDHSDQPADEPGHHPGEQPGDADHHHHHAPHAPDSHEECPTCDMLHSIHTIVVQSATVLDVSNGESQSLVITGQIAWQDPALDEAAPRGPPLA